MIHSRPLLIAGMFAAAAAASLVACKPDATPQARKAEKWLVDFYVSHAIRGGWGLFGAEAKGSDVTVIVNVPQRQAEELAALSSDEQVQIVRRAACPPFDQDVWTILGDDGDVLIETRNKGNVISTVPCRANVKGALQ